MSLFRKLRYLLPSRRRAWERDMEAELRSLAEIAADDAVESGAAPPEAGYAARRALGSLALAKEDARAVWGWTWLESVFADLHYALRALRRQPAFAAVAIVSLALGVGANTAVFSIIDSLLLRELPVRDPATLVALNNGWSSSYFIYNQLAANSSRVFSGVFCRQGPEPRDVDPGGSSLRASVDLVSGSFFPALGVPALLGRTIAPEDDRRGHPSPVAVVSYGFWQRQFGGDPSVIGRTIRVQRAPYTVIGVAPPEFSGIAIGEAADVWLPLTTLGSAFPGRDWLDRPRTNFLQVFARLQPGVTLPQAASALTPFYAQLKNDRKANLRLTPAINALSWLRKQFAEPLRVVFAMVGIVLLLACVNLMNLELAHASERRRELAVRLAIGASRARVFRQLLTESILLALAGGALGLLICGPVAQALVALVQSRGEPVLLNLDLNAAVLAFALAISLAAALVFGVLPAWRATRGELGPAIQQGWRLANTAPERRLLRRGLASVQIALSLFLVAGAVLFAASFYQLTHTDVGLERRHLVRLDVDAAEAGYQGSRALLLSRRLLDRLSAVPGVESVTVSEHGPYAGNSETSVEAEGFQSANPRDHHSYFDQVGPRYFSTLGARLLAGRDFDDRDNLAAPRVVIVNERFARHFFAARNPIGRAIEVLWRNTRTACRIVGVVKDMRSEDIRSDVRPYFYLPFFQTADEFVATRFFLRARGHLAAAASSLRQAVRAEDPALPVLGIDTVDDLVGRQFGRERLIAALSVAFGVLALTLAAAGIYGLLAYEVARRTGEIGIRMALGANKAAIVRLIIGEVTPIAICGVLAGTLAALASGKLVTSLVFGLRPHNPLVLAAAALILTAVALCAALWPARRAAQLDPIVALRHE